MIWNRKESILPFANQEKKYLENPKRYYWIVKNSNHKTWAILMHQYGGRADYMVKQAKIYFGLGCSLLLIDARSHGISTFVRESTAVRYGWDMLEILSKEEIKSVFLHGVSFGAIGILTAMKTIPKNIEVKGIIIEAAMKDVKNIYKHLIQYSPIPFLPYFWFPKIMRFRKRSFDWDGYAPELIIKELTVPIFIIHSEFDHLYKPKIHFKAFENSIIDKSNSSAWLVPGALHTKMSQHPDWEKKVTAFIEPLLK